MDALPPDPYLALGVAPDATAAAIKTQYRKLVLKFHPDKVQDEAQKQIASDQFHKIQTAYEIVSDDERRARYDAQCRLSELRKDVMERGGGGGRGGVDVRTAAYKMPPESNRGGDYFARGPERASRVSPTYEERRPSYTGDYFDLPPRTPGRKDSDYERTSKRAPPREERERTRASPKESKENERASRKEKSRRTENDVRRDRDRKFASATVEEDTTDDSDQYERTRRRMQAEDERRARDTYYEQVRRQKEEADEGLYADPRVNKIFTQESDAREYMKQTQGSNRDRPESEPRPSAVRRESSKDKVEYIKRGEGRPPVMIRRGSGRPKPTGRDSYRGKASSRDKFEVLEEPEEMPLRRPPTLNQTKSSPADIRPAFERQRSYSLQEDHKEEPTSIPQMRRSETMPTSQSHAPARESRRKEPSKLREEVKEAYPTPETSPEPHGRKYHYGQEYADDMEYPTPDGYRTELREPSARDAPPREAPPRETLKPSRRGLTRSPSPIREAPVRESREKPKSSSRKDAPPQPQRTTSHQYVYPPAGQGDSYSRPAMSRENSSRGALYGEVPTTTRSPRQPQSKYSPPPESVAYSQIRPEDIKIQTGYKRRGSEKPSYNRSGSSQQQSVYVR